MSRQVEQGFDPVTPYNRRFSSHKEATPTSIYEGTYYDTPIVHTVDAIVIAGLRRLDEMLTADIGKEKPKFRMLDFGCGDGRYRTAAYKIAQYARKKNIDVELVAYDIAGEGLEQFKRKLDEDKAKGLYPDNLSTQFILGSASPEDIEHNKKLIGQVDISMALFGVTSHIPGRANRINTYRMLKEITRSEVLVTAPGWRILPMELAQHNELRERGMPYKLATEPGDVYYTAKDGSQNFYHIYNSKNELYGELAEAGLVGKISIEKIAHETTLSYRPKTLGRIDQFFSHIANHYLPESINEYLTGYHLARFHDKETNILPIRKGGLAHRYIQTEVVCTSMLRSKL